MRRVRFTPTAIVIATVTAAFAAPAALALTANPVIYLPATANTAGLYGAVYRTRVFIRARNDEAITLAVTAVTPSGFLTTTLVVASNYASDNILEDLFHYSGGAALSFTLAPASNPGTFVMRAEVYTAGPCGEMSTPLPLLTFEDEVSSAPVPFGSLSVSVGLRSDSGHRLNVGCSNFGGDPVLVGTSNGSASVYWGHTFSLSPGQWAQTAVDSTSLAEPFSLYFAAQNTAHPGVALPIFCYAVIVSNESNDGTLVPAIPDSPVFSGH